MSETRTPVPQWMRDAAAVKLAPELFWAVMVASGEAAPPVFYSLPEKIRAQWLANAEAVINVLKGPPPEPKTEPEATRKTFAVILGGKL